MPTEKYFEALRLTQKHHAEQNKTFSGQFTWKNRHRIKEIIDRFDVHSILDYGCGKCKQYLDNVDEKGQNLEQYWGIKTTKYDPGVPMYSSEPKGTFDLVICVQVLGSIPRVDLPWVVNRLYGFTNKAIFVSERLGTPRKQIYASMVEDMPHGLSREEWRSILYRVDAGNKKMIAAFKTEEGWKIDELP